MSFPYMLYAGVTSGDTDYTALVSRKQQLLADARVTHWYVARDGDAAVSGTDATKITQFIDRKGGANAAGLGVDASRATLAVAAAYGSKKAASYTSGADRSQQIAGLDLTGTFFIAALAAKSAAATEYIFAIQQGSNIITLQGAASNAAFQFFRGAPTSGINILTGATALDTAPHLVFGTFDGTNVKGAQGRGAISTIAGSGSPPAAGSVAYLGRAQSTGTPGYLGGSIAQIIIGNVDIFATANTDLRELICGHIEEYYGLMV